jgi:2'-5' RNA ligase
VRGAATVEGDERIRLFLALELPEDVVGALRDWSESHLEHGRRLDSFHVTLAFLGHRPRSELAGVLDVLRRCAADTPRFLLTPSRYRETRSVGMLVLDDSSGEATRLATRLQARLEELGVYRREERPWLPHVTVLRLGERARDPVAGSRKRSRQRPPLPEIGPFAPSGAAAFLSRLRRTGAQYEMIESCSLGLERAG